jgi:hypothetical protein
VAGRVLKRMGVSACRRVGVVLVLVLVLVLVPPEVVP